MTTNYYLKIKLAIFVNFLEYKENEIVRCFISKLAQYKVSSSSATKRECMFGLKWVRTVHFHKW